MNPFQQPAVQELKPRPSTAPISDVETLSQILPPKRELPFVKTSQRRAGVEKIASHQQARATSTHLTSLSRPDAGSSGMHSPTPVETTTGNTSSQPGGVQYNSMGRSLLPSPNISPAKPASVLEVSQTADKQQHQQQALPSPQMTGDPISSADLSSYLSTPTAERSALVESWVCQQLESDGFLALCQDMEGVWKRVAFGL